MYTTVYTLLYKYYRIYTTIYILPYIHYHMYTTVYTLPYVHSCIYTTIYKIINKNLLASTGNSAQCSIIDIMGK